MKNHFRLIVQLLALFLSVSVYAKDVISEEYNGKRYDFGYVYDFQVDSIFYIISEEGGVYVSPEKCLFTIDNPEPEVINSYHGVVNIPETVMYDGKVYDVNGIFIAAFKGCCNLDSVIMPNSLDAIEKYAFYGCTNLTGICFPEEIKWIGGYAFYGCTKLKKVELPKGLFMLDQGAFNSCINLQYVIIPKGITLMSGDVFSGCEQMEKIIIMSSTPIRIMNNGTGIYYEHIHFKGVSRTKCTIYVPENSIAEYKNADVWNTFQNIEPIPGLYTEGNINYVINSTTEKTVSIVDAKCSGDFIVPSSVLIDGEKYTVNRIDDYAFYGNESLYSVSFPECLTSIGKYAFGCCVSIAEIIIPDNIEYVDNFSFYNCRDLKKIVIKGNTQLYESAFAWCYDIDSIIIESKIPPTLRNNYDPWYISDGPFDEETYENAIVCIPDGTFYVYAASDTWSRFSSFYSYFGEGYQADIDNDTIYYTYQDDGVFVGARVVRRSCFSGKNSLDGPLTPRDPTVGGLQPRIPKRSSSQGTASDSVVFTPYRGNVVIPETISVNNRTYPVTGISYLAFVGSKELESVIIPECVKRIGYASFAGCSGLKNLTLPSGITEIPEAMFYCCSSFDSMKIPEGVRTIANSAFCGCTGLTEITIPAGVELIDQYAFAYCTSLKRVVIEGNPVIDETAFVGCGTDLEVIYTVVEPHKAVDPDSAGAGSIHYGIDGRKIQSDTPGLHLIKRRDGTVVKTWVH